MNAPFATARLTIAQQEPPPEVIAELFLDLDEIEAERTAIMRRLSDYRQKFMARERCYGLDQSAYRREIEARARA